MKGFNRVERRLLQSFSSRANRPLDLRICLERVTGIEPAWPAWKAGALPLSYARVLRNGGAAQAYLLRASPWTGAVAEAVTWRSRRLRLHNWCTGVWRSLVAHSLWERGAVGSNPATPTRQDRFDQD